MSEASKRGVIRATRVLEISNLAHPYLGYPLGRKLHQQGLTLGQASKAFGVSRADLSHFIRNRFNKVSRVARRKIRMGLRSSGVWLEVKRLPKLCWNCGVLDPHKPLVSKSMKRKPRSQSQ